METEKNIEYLTLIPGFRTALADGTLVPGSPGHMATEMIYPALPGSRLRLNQKPGSERYVFAPAIFSKERNPLYIYSYAYQPEENWAVYTRNLTPDNYQQEDYIFKEECWFRVCVKRKDGGSLTEEDNQAAGGLIAFIQETEPIRQAQGTCLWLEQEIQKTVKKICAYAETNPAQSHPAQTLSAQNSEPAVRSAVLKLCLLADTHYTINGIWDDTAYAITSVAKTVGYDAVIHLGDLTDGMLSKEMTSIYVKRILEDLERCSAPVFITPGNHDSNYFRNRERTFTVEEMKELYRLYGAKESRASEKAATAGKKETEVQSRDIGRELSYYVDLPFSGSFLVRLVFLASFDDAAPVRYGYTDAQLVWLRSVLYNAPKGTKFLVFSHGAPLAKLDYWSFYVRNGEELLDILEECNAQKDYQIAGFFYGHTHGDYVFRECSFPVVSVGCAKLEYFLDKKPEGTVTPYREAGTASQELWDSLLVDFEKEKLKFIRFGAGQDREVSFQKKRVGSGCDSRGCYRATAALLRTQRKTKVWAHRGASGHAPENTLPAFELALQMGADGIELDVQLTKDGVPVVIHDERVDRVSDGSGWVKDYSFEELRALNVNQNPLFLAYGKVQIPTLEEVYDLVQNSDVTINLELKNNQVFYDFLEEQVLRLAEEKGLAERVIYSSFNHESIRRIQKLKPGSRTAFLYNDGILDIAGYAVRYGVYAVHPSCIRVGFGESGKKTDERKAAEFIRKCHEKNLRVHVWSVNEPADIARMNACGADAIITDYIERG